MVSLGSVYPSTISVLLEMRLDQARREGIYLAMHQYVGETEAF